MIVKIATQTWVKELLKGIRKKGGLAAGLKAPTMTVGSVTTGATPSASVTNTDDGYTLNLVMPEGVAGKTPTISIGTVDSGPNAAASLTGDAATGYKLNLTLPTAHNG